MKIKLCVISLLFLLASPLVEACEETYVKYFSWAVLKEDPPKPTNEISKEEALSRENNGEAYYIGTYCKIGEILFLEKRWNKKQFSKIKYNYENGKYVGVVLIKDEEYDL